MWQRIAEFELLFPVTHAFRHGTEIARAMEPNQNAAWAETSRTRALNGMRNLDTVLRDRAFVADADFSVTDITTLCAVDFGVATGAVQIPDDLQNLKRWHNAMSARPSAKA